MTCRTCGSLPPCYCGASPAEVSFGVALAVLILAIVLVLS